jgi:hypothetical protein
MCNDREVPRQGSTFNCIHHSILYNHLMTSQGKSSIFSGALGAYTDLDVLNLLTFVMHLADVIWRSRTSRQACLHPLMASICNYTKLGWSSSSSSSSSASQTQKLKAKAGPGSGRKKRKEKRHGRGSCAFCFSPLSSCFSSGACLSRTFAKHPHQARFSSGL